MTAPLRELQHDTASFATRIPTSSLGSAFLDEPPSLLPVIPDSFSSSFSFRSVSVPICSSKHRCLRGHALHQFFACNDHHICAGPQLAPNHALCQDV